MIGKCIFVVMDTRNTIVHLADHLIREKGYNAFSFKDISQTVGIKTASIHYHFATKTDLGIAVIRLQLDRLEEIKKETAGKPALAKLKAFLSIYARSKAENKICLVGSMGSDFNTFEQAIRKEVRSMTTKILEWVTGILEEGRKKKEFRFEGSARTKALMIITNMLASLQLTRLTSDKDFELIKQTIIKDLTK